jgi:hypothetical protein
LLAASDNYLNTVIATFNEIFLLDGTIFDRKLLEMTKNYHKIITANGNFCFINFAIASFKPKRNK